METGFLFYFEVIPQFTVSQTIQNVAGSHKASKRFAGMG